MVIDHIAIWTKQLERLKDYYVKYFNGRANEKYLNKEKHFESYFVAFDSGARLELMKMPGIPATSTIPSGNSIRELSIYASGWKTWIWSIQNLMN